MLSLDGSWKRHHPSKCQIHDSLDSTPSGSDNRTPPPRPRRCTLHAHPVQQNHSPSLKPSKRLLDFRISSFTSLMSLSRVWQAAQEGERNEHTEGPSPLHRRSNHREKRPSAACRPPSLGAQAHAHGCLTHPPNHSRGHVLQGRRATAEGSQSLTASL